MDVKGSQVVYSDTHQGITMKALLIGNREEETKNVTDGIN